MVLIFFSKKPSHSIVHDAVEFAKKFKKSKLVNAVLRNVLRDQEKIIIGNNIPQNFKKILDQIFSSNEIRSYLYESFFNKPKNYQISLKNRSDAIYDQRVLLLKSNLLNGCFVQDIGNYEIIRASHTHFKSSNILDICAAPGGKSILLKSLNYEIECIDKSLVQINKFKDNLKRLNLNINIQKKDFLKMKFTKKISSILLDAPCSALGTFRRNPDVATKINLSKLRENQKIQAKMLQKAIQILDKNGVVVYIVCSFHPYETVDVIDKIKEKHQDISILRLQSDKLIWKSNGFLINPFKFKEFGGSDIFFVSVLKKN